MRDEADRFVALLPMSLFRHRESINFKEVDRLLTAIENRSVRSTFGTSAIANSVREEESLVTVLPKLRESRFGLLPVTSSRDKLLGVLCTDVVETRIADTVIAAQRRV